MPEDQSESVGEEKKMTDDLISRKALIEAFKEEFFGMYSDDFKYMINWLEELPTAEPEIIRCKDCKFYKGLAVCMIHGEKCGGTNYFCAWAERRTDG